MTLTFSGSSATFTYLTNPDAGIATVTLDGASQPSLDEYSQFTTQQVRHAYSAASGTHTLTLNVSGSKNAASSGTRLYVDAFTVAGTSATSTPAPTNTPQPTATNTSAPTNTAAPTSTSSPTPSATNTQAPTATGTSNPTATGTSSPTATRTLAATATSTPSATTTPVATATPGGSGPTLSASPNPLTTGGSLLVSWSGIVAPTSTDWLAVFPVGGNAANTGLWVYVNCAQAPTSAAAAGSCTLPAPSAAGNYHVQLLAHNGFAVLADVQPLVVTAAATATATPGPTLTLSSGSVAAGANVTLTWATVGTPSATDWLAIFPVGANPLSTSLWVYVNCAKTPTSAVAAGSCTLSAPSAAGNYDVQLLAHNGSTVLADVQPLTVSAVATATATPGPVLSLSSSSVPGGANVTLTWATIGSPSATDWLAVFPVGGSALTTGLWVYVNCSQSPTSAVAAGSCTLRAPSAAGNYDVQLLARNGSAVLADVQPLVVSAVATATPTPGATLSLSSSSVTGGANVTVTWANIGSPSTTDWLAVFPVGGNALSTSLWVYVNCSQTPTSAAPAGSCTLRAPTTAGNYDVQLLARNGSTVLADVQPLAVSAAATATATPGPTLSLSSSSVASGSNVTITWATIGSPSATDWLAIFPVGGNVLSTGLWVYVDCSQTPSSAVPAGSCTLRAPRTAGNYDVQLLARNGTTVLADLQPLVVSAAPTATPTP
ncbi:MAG: hypothetical protein JO247_07560 [Chloroflexi bacterium]|nr:hypothetical protein [Chloroflexota bacterium]